MADTKKFLDQQGVTYLWGEIKNQLNAKADTSRVTTAEETLTTVGGKVDTLVGSDTNKSVRTIANEELATQLIPKNAKTSLNELQEIAAWIQQHPDDAAAMNSAITALQNKLTLGYETETTEYATVKAYVEAYVAAAIATIHTHSNKAVLDGITTEKVTAWDAAAANSYVALTNAEIDEIIASTANQNSTQTENGENLESDGN